MFASECVVVVGQYADLLRLFSRGGFPPATNYLFLGDYVDRGKQNLETICLLFAYKLKYPENFFLLRGNHECAPINRVYGFYAECERRYSVSLWNAFQLAFSCLPYTALVAGKIFCMHGGLSPHLKTFEQLKNLETPHEPENPSVHIDLLWADPDRWVRGFQPNTRGVSYVFGPAVVSEFCQRLNIDMVARAHQVFHLPLFYLKPIEFRAYANEKPATEYQ